MASVAPRPGTTAPLTIVGADNHLGGGEQVNIGGGTANLTYYNNTLLAPYVTAGTGGWTTAPPPTPPSPRSAAHGVVPLATTAFGDHELRRPECHVDRIREFGRHDPDRRRRGIRSPRRRQCYGAGTINVAGEQGVAGVDHQHRQLPFSSNLNFGGNEGIITATATPTA